MRTTHDAPKGAHRDPARSGERAFLADVSAGRRRLSRLTLELLAAYNASTIACDLEVGLGQVTVVHAA